MTALELRRKKAKKSALRGRVSLDNGGPHKCYARLIPTIKKAPSSLASKFNADFRGAKLAHSSLHAVLHSFRSMEGSSSVLCGPFPVEGLAHARLILRTVSHLQWPLRRQPRGLARPPPPGALAAGVCHTAAQGRRSPATCRTLRRPRHAGSPVPSRVRRTASAPPPTLRSLPSGGGGRPAARGGCPALGLPLSPMASLGQCLAGAVAGRAGPPLGLPPRRGRPPGQPRGATVVRPDHALSAAVRRVALTPGRRWRRRGAGSVLGLPLVAPGRCDRLGAHAAAPGAPMGPAPRARRRGLAVQGLAKDRRRPRREGHLEEARGRGAGLQSLPQTPCAPDDSSRTPPGPPHRWVAGWLTPWAPLRRPDASPGCRAVPPLPARGAPTGLATPAIPQRGHAGPRGLTLCAHAPDRRVVC
jgi:hypothetical protein